MSDMSAVMRDRIFNCRFDQYLNAVAHILNTGKFQLLIVTLDDSVLVMANLNTINSRGWKS